MKPKKLDKREKVKMVACSNCGWRGYTHSLQDDKNGYEHCPECRQGDWSHIYDDEHMEDL